VTAPSTDSPLPNPPDELHFGDVRLRLDRVVPGVPSLGHVPYYHFRILLTDGTDVGHINFRVGDTEHVRLFAGHIGFGVRESCRGHGYAFQACHAIAPLVRSLFETVIITCDPGNIASIRTTERLGATFIDEIAVSPNDSHCKQEARFKRRYAWTP
jgi:tagatose 1,6-diphosphate aldolase